MKKVFYLLSVLALVSTNAYSLSTIIELDVDTTNVGKKLEKKIIKEFCEFVSDSAETKTKEISNCINTILSCKADIAITEAEIKLQKLSISSPAKRRELEDELGDGLILRQYPFEDFVFKKKKIIKDMESEVISTRKLIKVLEANIDNLKKANQNSDNLSEYVDDLRLNGIDVENRDKNLKFAEYITTCSYEFRTSDYWYYLRYDKETQMIECKFFSPLCTYRKLLTDNSFKKNVTALYLIYKTLTQEELDSTIKVNVIY